MGTTVTEWARILVNGQERRMHPGPHEGARIKAIGEVPAGDELEQVVNKELIPVGDQTVVTIAGDEVFVSHPPTGGSS